MLESVSTVLAASGQGKAYYCACRDRLTLEFQGRWFAFDYGGLIDFRNALGKLMAAPALLEGLIEEACGEALRRGAEPGSLPTLADLGGMLELLDAALLVWEAQTIAREALER